MYEDYLFTINIVRNYTNTTPKILISLIASTQKLKLKLSLYCPKNNPTRTLEKNASAWFIYRTLLSSCFLLPCYPITV